MLPNDAQQAVTDLNRCAYDMFFLNLGCTLL